MSGPDRGDLLHADAAAAAPLWDLARAEAPSPAPGSKRLKRSKRARSSRRSIWLARLAVVPLFVAGLSIVPAAPLDAALARGTITTFAGGLGGPAGASISMTPTGFAISGVYLYVSDASASVVRRVNLLNFTQTVYAGNGTDGFSGDGGPATAAQLSDPRGLALNAEGDLLIADSSNGRVRLVDSATGVITTHAGGGAYVCCPPPGTIPSSTTTAGPTTTSSPTTTVPPAPLNGDGGPATSAYLSNPTDVAFDSAGNLFIMSSGERRVREVDPGGTITTAVGTGMYPYFGGDGGPATSATISWATGIAVDANDDLLIADTNNNRIREVSNATGNIDTIAGGGGPYGFCGDGLPATSACLNDPTDVWVDANGRVLIADTYNNRIRRIGTGGIISTIAGTGIAGYSGDGGDATLAELFQPVDVITTPSGTILIADMFNDRLRRIDLGGTISTVTGNGGSALSGDGGPATSAQIGQPAHLAVDPAGNTYIVDSLNGRVRRVDPAGNIATFAGNGIATGPYYYPPPPFAGFNGDGGPATDAVLYFPMGIGVGPGGDVFISEPQLDQVRRVDRFGVITTFAGDGTSGSGGDGGPATSAQLNGPAGLAANAAGELFIADMYNNKIRKVDAFGNIDTFAGDGTAGSGGDGGPATSAQLNRPTDVAIDSFFDVFFTDAGNYAVRSVDGAGVIDTEARTVGSPGALEIDGAGTVFYTAGRLVVSDSGAGDVSILAGIGPPGYGGDGGPSTSALIRTPTGLVLDARGDLLFGDSNAGGCCGGSSSTSRVREIIGAGAVLPDAPTDVTAVPSSHQAMVTWTPPAFDGNSPITGYTVTVSPGGATVDVGAGITGATITGLTNLTAYTFSVTPRNAVGAGASGVSNVAVPRPTGGGFHSLPPARILDTRSNLGIVGKVGAVPKDLTVVGVGGVPATNVGAVVINTTATGGNANSFLTLYPAGTPQPNASNVNFAAGQTIPNLVIVKVGTGGKITIANANGLTDVVGDIQGYYDDGSVPGDLYNALPPSRILDTRSNLGIVGKVGAVPKDLTVVGVGGVPATNVSAVVMNTTATGGNANSYLTLYPKGAAPPIASNVNFAAGETIPNLVIVKVGTGGKITIANANGATDVVGDIVGYFTSTDPGGGYVALPPSRVLDTRLGLGIGGKVGSVPKDLTVLGVGGVPLADVSAVIINVTATGGDANSFLTLFPAGTAPPIASNVNFAAGQTIPNLVIVKVGAGGKITIVNANGLTDVVGDVVGYVSDP